MDSIHAEDNVPSGSDGQSRPLTKWGAAAVPGWQALPDVLLKNQASLDLSAVDMLVLINVLSHWWYAEKKPFPRVTSIAKRMNVTVRTVQRSMRKLVDSGLLERRQENGPDGTERELLDPRGLVHKLQELAHRDRAYHFKQQKIGPDGLPKIPF